MKLLRAATLTVEDLDRTTDLYGRYFDYRVVEEGALPEALAEAWGAPRSAGLPYAVIQPASGARVFIRFVQQPRVEGFRALRSHGWNAIEICVEDVLAANARMEGSPFEIIGPPREIDGLPAIHPMQVKGPDEEIVYLTQIKDDLPAFDLPRAASPIDKLFILVMGCSDLDASLRFWEAHAGLSFGRDMEIVYTMLAKAYGSDPDALHRIATMVHERDVFLELDQYPEEATARPRHEGMLVPGCAVGSFLAPDFGALPGRWTAPPAAREGVIYEGRRAGTIEGPDGTLFELIEGAP
jgi:catechol 2,3-dioxygenase-like lactoylglutathione lyase family enzyme